MGTSTARRLAVLGLAVLAWGASTSLATAWVVRDLARADSALQRHRRAELAVVRVENAYLNQETAIRGYVMTGDDSFLEPYRTGRIAVDVQLSRLGLLVGRDGQLRADLETVRRAGEAWSRDLAEANLADMAAGDTAAAIARVRSGVGKERFDTLRWTLTVVDTDLAAEVQDILERRDELQQRLVAVLVGAFAVGVAGYVVSIRLLRSWITRPLAAIVEATDAISRGSFDVVVPVTGPADVQQLGRSVETMRREIVQRLRDAERAREAVTQQATVVLELQQNLTASLVDLPAGWSIEAALVPATGLVAGDCYDMLALSGGRFAVFVLDISGHGAEAAVTALRCKEVLRAALRAGRDPAAAIGFLAQHLGDTGGDFVTAVVLMIDPVTASIRWANAGHPSILLRTVDGVEELLPTGPVVGPFSGRWNVMDGVLEPGSALVLYTDGLTEARSPDGVFFGDENLASLVASVGPVPDARTMLDAVMDHLEAFRSGAAHDDTTVVVVSRAS